MNLNGAMIIARTDDAVYIRIPRDIASAIDGGCLCEFCKANPNLVPQWDTLCVPTGMDWKNNYASTVHMPDPRSFNEYAARTPQLKTYTKYTDWLESKDRKKARNWAVTHELRPNGGMLCEVLQWEDSNAKWYRLNPLHGREEAGCYWTIWGAGNMERKIVNVRPV